MSSIPNNGLVTVSFQVDRSAVDSYLAELRKGVTIPVRSDYNGPAGPPAASAASIAGSNGPATFGNLSGAPVYGSGGSGIFAGGPTQGVAAMTLNMGNVGYGSYSTASAGGAQAGAAASEIKSAASTFSAAVGQLVGALKGGTAGGAAGAILAAPGGYDDAESERSYGAPGGGGSGRRGRGPFGISRYAAGFIAADVGLQAVSMGRQYAMARSGAYGSPSGMASAELGLADRVSNFSIFGLPIGAAISTMVDPLGSTRSGIQDTLDAASAQDAVGAGRWAMGNQLLGMRDQAGIAGMRGFGRTRAEIAAQHRVNIAGIDETRRQQTERLETLGRIEVQQIEDKHSFASMMPGWFPGVKGSMAQMAKEEDAQQSTQSHQINALNPVVAAMKAAADQSAAGANAENDRKKRLAGDALAYQRGASIWRSRGMEGYAKEQEFWAQTSMELLNADPELIGPTGEAVSRERAGHNAMLKFDLQFEKARNTAIAQRLEYKGVESSITMIRAQTERDIRQNGRTDQEVKALRTTGAGQEALEHQNAQDRYLASAMPVGISNESLRLQLGASSHGVGAAMASINNIARGAEFSAYETNKRQDMEPDDRRKLAQMQLQHGKLQLEQFQQDFYASSRPTQIQSINQQALNGPGTANASSVTAEIQKQTAILTHLLSAASSMQKNLDELMRSDLVN